jgi:ion channel POLLUX/CASTOR
VYEVNHDVILGWNSRLPRVLRQIAIAGESNRERVRVVVLANERKDMMDSKVQELTNRGEFKNIVITCRSGDPMSSQDQQLVAIDHAKSVLILSGKDDSVPASESDSLALGTALALKHGSNCIPNRSTVIESKVAANHRLFSQVGENVKDLGWPELASRQLVKSVVQPNGLIATYRELLDFEGSELFLHVRLYASAEQVSISANPLAPLQSQLCKSDIVRVCRS